MGRVTRTRKSANHTTPLRLAKDWQKIAECMTGAFARSEIRSGRFLGLTDDHRAIALNQFKAGTSFDSKLYFTIFVSSVMRKGCSDPTFHWRGDIG
jgi:hypothetical protein